MKIRKVLKKICQTEWNRKNGEIGRKMKQRFKKSIWKTKIKINE